MSIVDEFLKAREACKSGGSEAQEAFDAAAQAARDAGYFVAVPNGDVSLARISETGAVAPEKVFVTDPAPAPNRKRTFLKDNRDETESGLQPGRSD